MVGFVMCKRLVVVNRHIKETNVFNTTLIHVF